MIAHNHFIASTIASAVMLAIGAGAANGTALPCAIGNSTQFGSGWCDLNPPHNFKKGDRITLHLAPGAAKVLVRLLAIQFNPADAVGFVGGAHTVRNNTVSVTLRRDMKNIKQISVHGGPAPFNIPLGYSNPAAVLISVDVH